MRGGGNRNAALVTLRNLATAQEQFQRYGAVDRDGDGASEYGPAYDGSRGPLADAASSPGAGRGTNTGEPAIHARGTDGRLWSSLE